MSTHITNPFSVNSYLGPEYFCDRENELKTLELAMNNGCNLTFISPRRMGKTGLIKHFFQTLFHGISGKYTVYDRFFSLWLQTM